MDDTPRHVQEIYRRQIMALTPEERLRMASSLFDTARALVLAGLPPGEEPRRALFLRFYGHDFPDPAQRERILAALLPPSPD
ncbi:hypothetical protein FJ251_01465 [bacterium]|nr:hypothetical protein [bacterium]